MPLLGCIMTISGAGSPTTKSVIEENMTWSRSVDRPETNEIREVRQESRRRRQGQDNLRGLSALSSARIDASEESFRVEAAGETEGKLDFGRNDFERATAEEEDGRWRRGTGNGFEEGLERDIKGRRKFGNGETNDLEEGGNRDKKGCGSDTGSSGEKSVTETESSGKRKKRSATVQEAATETFGAGDSFDGVEKQKTDRVEERVEDAETELGVKRERNTEFYEKSTLSAVEQSTKATDADPRNARSAIRTITKHAKGAGAPKIGAAVDCECSKSNDAESKGLEGEVVGEVVGNEIPNGATDTFGPVEDLEDQLLFRFENTMEKLCDSFNDSFNESLPFPWNNSLYNETFIVMGEGMYPSGYTLPHIILASIVATLLMIVIVVGNMLVIIAIATEKALKSITNWFIASLAVADFFLGLVIMPFSLANEIMGYWIFGYWWCDIYSAMDVLLCTASIMNLCLISLDRFWSITQAVVYLKKRTPARAALMIALVWILSALVCIPPLLGWKRPTPEEEYPKCKLSEDIGYVLYSALGSFYIPSCIMVFVYIRIYFAAKARARRGIRKQPRPRPAVPPESPDVRQTSFTQSTPATDSRRTPGSAMENVATIENQPVQIPIVTCDFASDVSTSEADPGGGSSIPLEEKDTLKVSIPIIVQKTNLKASLSVNGDGQSGQSVPPRCRAASVGIDVDMVSEFDPSSSDSGVVSRCAVVKPLKLRLCQPIFGRKNVGKLKREHGDVSRGHASKDDASMETAKPRDPEREKRRLARKKEKRATLILGFIMGSFIVCWLPFFVLYIVKPLFPDVEIPSQAFVIAFWLGYMNSAFNPFIYTVFNKDFRRAFRRILFK